MNIFYLNNDPQTCAEMHVDKHVVKMILEYAQLLSTAHRVCDGTLYEGVSEKGRKYKAYRLKNEFAEKLLYKATHINHPSAIWVRLNQQNYKWLSELLMCLCKEYTYRYGKTHAVELSGLAKWLNSNVPLGLWNLPFTEPTPAMPDDVKVENNSLASYHNYYMKEKRHIASWKNRPQPGWYK